MKEKDQNHQQNQLNPITDMIFHENHDQIDHLENKSTLNENDEIDCLSNESVENDADNEMANESNIPSTMIDEYKKIELSAQAWMEYFPQFLSTAEADQLFQALLANEKWEHRAIIVAQKPVLQPRLMSWAGELPYQYTGQTLEPRTVSPILQSLCERIEKHCQARFNHIVINYYRDGKDHIGMHADDEPELGWNPLIAALSLGSSRSFVVEPKARKGKRRIFRVNLKHASLLVMGGDIQHRWRHGVPKSNTHLPRLNITFRFLQGPPGTPRPIHPAILQKMEASK
jgi:alkylated DNA repair dioxygenase AlkB